MILFKTRVADLVSSDVEITIVSDSVDRLVEDL